MRFLHIGDLHIGKQLNDVSFLDDQRVILDQISAIAAEEAVDAVLIAGDVYQRSAPQAEAMALFDKFLTSLTARGLKVFIISGNHDSSQRISYFSRLIRSSGVYASEGFEGVLQSIELQDGYGPLKVHLLPFIRPLDVRRRYPDDKDSITTYQDAVCAVLRNSPVDTDCRNILVSHQFITGSETCDSEELAVGGLDNIDASVFAGFDYVALGHIHKPQRLTRDTLRYAGSPLKYSFSEVNHRKSVTVVDVRAKGDISVKTVPLRPIRDMRLVEGMFDDLMQLPPTDDYVWVTVNDELVHPDARLSLTSVFPNMLKFSVSNSKTKFDADVTIGEGFENKSVTELFVDFYRTLNSDQPPSPAHLDVLEGILKQLEEERHEAG